MSYEDANNKLLLMFKLYKMIPDGKFKVATASAQLQTFLELF